MTVNAATTLFRQARTFMLIPLSVKECTGGPATNTAALSDDKLLVLRVRVQSKTACLYEDLAEDPAEWFRRAKAGGMCA
jgi:hypothetical protein